MDKAMAPSSVRRWFRHRQGDGSVIGQAMVPSSAGRWFRPIYYKIRVHYYIKLLWHTLTL
ncbi:hypothetical protein JCM10003_1676 [Bacteroides pyogenes JCM 10003]|nr:hypothetical protein JCM10003_1676 [Bacteroides pyogenes JCM 10003]